MNARRGLACLLCVLLPAGLAAQGIGAAAARERAKRAAPAAEGRQGAPKEDAEHSAPPAETQPALDPTSTPLVTQALPEPLAALQPQEPRPKHEPFAVRWHGVELHARFLGWAFSDRTESATDSDLAADNVRFELRWRPRPWLRAVLEWDHERMIARDLALREVQLKDAFVELRPGRFRIRAGQFKSPISPIEMESRWDVPSTQRGLLSELLGFSFGISGRKPGLQLSWDQPGGPLVATAAVQRATSTRGERIGDESFDNVAQDGSALTTTARLAWQGKRLELAGVFDLRPAEPVPGEGYQRFWTAGADLSWRTRSRAGARAWAEGYVGSSWQDANAFDGNATRFLAGRVLGAWSFWLRERDSFYVEPFVMASLVEPDTTVREDLIWEASGGLHLGAFGHLRLVLEAQRRVVSRNAPASLGVAKAGGPPASSRTRLAIQIGAAF